MPVQLTLGPIEFQDFQVPERIPFGGRQMLVKKKFVGGSRTIDAMGRDDADLTWSGRFRGEDATSSAQQLDYIRVQGQQQILSWGEFLYLVAIEEFSPNYMQPYEIPYTITCAVIQDLTSPIAPVQPDVDYAIDDDVDSSSLLAGTINVQDIVTAVAAVASQVNVVAKFTGASASDVAGVQTSIQSALGVVNTQQVLQNNLVVSNGNVAGMVAGLDPAALSVALGNQSRAFLQLGNLYQLQSLLQRTSLNVANSGS